MFIGTCSRQYSSATFYYTTTKSDEAKANAEVFFAVYTLIFFAGSLILFAFVRNFAWCEQALTDREQQRIQDFPEGTKLQGGANSQEGTNLVFGQMFQKTAWKWRKLNRRGKMNDRKVSSSESPFESRHHLILCGLWMAQYENEVPTRIRVSGHLRTLIRNIVQFRLKVRRCPMLLIKVWRCPETHPRTEQFKSHDSLHTCMKTVWFPPFHLVSINRKAENFTRWTKITRWNTSGTQQRSTVVSVGHLLSVNLA